LVLRRIQLLKEELARREREAKIADSIFKSTEEEQTKTEQIESNLTNPDEPVLTNVTAGELSTPAMNLPQPGVNTGGKGPLSSEAKVPYWLQEEILAGMEKLEGDNYYVATSIIQEHFDGKIVSDSEIDIEELPPACVNKLVTYIRHTINTQMKGKEECKDNRAESERVANRRKVLVDSKPAITQVEGGQPEVPNGGKTVIPETKHETPQGGKSSKSDDKNEIPKSGKSTTPEDKPSEKVEQAQPAASGNKISDEAQCPQKIESNES